MERHLHGLLHLLFEDCLILTPDIIFFSYEVAGVTRPHIFAISQRGSVCFPNIGKTFLTMGGSQSVNNLVSLMQFDLDKANLGLGLFTVKECL